MDKKIKNYLFLAGFLVLGLGLGFFVAKNMTAKSPGMMSEKPAAQNKLYSNQSATIRGQITAVDGNSLSVKDLSNNETGTVKASNRIIIAKFSTNPKKPATPSSDLKTIDLNQDVVISLEMVDGSYEATLVQYLAPASNLKL